MVGYEIDGSAALVVRGRRVTVAGKGEVVISLAAAAGRTARRIVLKGREAVADLSALRFAAPARSREPFPAAKPPSASAAVAVQVMVSPGELVVLVKVSVESVPRELLSVAFVHA